MREVNENDLYTKHLYICVRLDVYVLYAVYL